MRPALRKPVPSKPRVRAVLDGAIDALSLRRSWTVITTIWPCVDHMMMAYTSYVLDLVPPKSNGAASHIQEVLGEICQKLENIAPETRKERGDMPSLEAVVSTLMDNIDYLARVRAASGKQTWDPTRGPIVCFAESVSTKPKVTLAPRTQREIASIDVKNELVDAMFSTTLKNFLQSAQPALI